MGTTVLIFGGIWGTQNPQQMAPQTSQHLRRFSRANTNLLFKSLLGWSWADLGACWVLSWGPKKPSGIGKHTHTHTYRALSRQSVGLTTRVVLRTLSKFCIPSMYRSNFPGPTHDQCFAFASQVAYDNFSSSHACSAPCFGSPKLRMTIFGKHNIW